MMLVILPNIKVLDGYALKTEIPTVPTNVSAFTNDAGYLTEHQSLADYALKIDLNNKQDKITSYVSKVNGKSGDVTLTYTDVNALPNTTVIPTVPTNVSAFTNDAGYLTDHQSLDAYALKTDLNNKQDKLTFDSTPTANSNNPVSSGGVKSALDAKAESSHNHSASEINSGTLSTDRLTTIPVTKGGTGYTSITDTTYTTDRYRASSLNSSEKNPTVNGTIAWMYE